MPGNMAVGATNDPENAFKAGKVIGSELSAVGVNTNFAPDADVNNNPNNQLLDYVHLVVVHNWQQSLLQLILKEFKVKT